MYNFESKIKFCALFLEMPWNILKMISEYPNAYLKCSWLPWGSNRVYFDFKLPFSVTLEACEATLNPAMASHAVLK